MAPAEDIYNENELLKRIAEGDEKAFASLFRIYTPLLEPFILGITKSSFLVDEMIQETFVRLWLNRDRLHEVEHARAWIFTITSNICFSYLRRKIVERKAVDRLSSGLESSHDDTGAYMQLKEIRELIREAVSNLPPQRQKIYLMSREQGLSIPEIAAILELSPHTVKNALVTALQAIREHIHRGGHFIALLVIWWMRL